MHSERHDQRAFAVTGLLSGLPTIATSESFWISLHCIAWRMGRRSPSEDRYRKGMDRHFTFIALGMHSSRSNR